MELVGSEMSNRWVPSFALGLAAASLAALSADTAPLDPGASKEVFAGSPEVFVVQSKTITLGAAVPLTGKLADTGRYYRDAYQFTVNTINQKGGIKVDGIAHKLVLKLIDNKSDAKRNALLHERLVLRHKVDFLLGPYSSNDVLAASSIAEKYRVPMVQAGGASSRIFSRGYKYVFGTLPPAEEYFRSTIDMIRQHSPQVKTVALVSGDDSFNVTLSTGTNALLKNAGLQIVLDQQYSENSPNFFNILTLIEAKAPDVLLWSGHESGAIRFIRAAKSRNLNPNLLASFTIGVSTATFRSTLGKDANGIFGMTPWLPAERLKDEWFGDARQFAEAYERKFGYAPDYHAAAAAAAVETLAKAIETAGTRERKAVRDAIAALDFASLYGRVRFGENGQIALPQTVIQIQNESVVEIFTDQFINQPLSTAPLGDKRTQPAPASLQN
jgi:branched-chain amino acid transport system substrate-binding protein